MYGGSLGFLPNRVQPLVVLVVSYFAYFKISYFTSLYHITFYFLGLLIEFREKNETEVPWQTNMFLNHCLLMTHSQA